MAWEARRESGRLSISNPHNQRQCGLETRDVAAVKTVDRLSHPRAAHRHRLVGHDLGAGPQAIALARLDRDAEIRRSTTSEVIWQMATEAWVSGNASVWTTTRVEAFRSRRPRPRSPVAALHRPLAESGASNSETASIQRRASASWLAVRRAT